MTGAAKGTILTLLANVGDACDVYQDQALKNLKCRRVQCDEIWSFCHAKERNIPSESKGDGVGDMWTWVGIDADTKLVMSWHLGKRSREDATAFVGDLASRIDSRTQLSTDGFGIYGAPVERFFGSRVDYGQAVKIFSSTLTDDPNSRYSPPTIAEVVKKRISGNPDPDCISTSFIERQNLTMRMGMRRFTRLTNAFSKKAENLERALALHYMHYNFCRKHQTLKTTPAIAAGITDRMWTLHDIARLPEILQDSAAA